MSTWRCGGREAPVVAVSWVSCSVLLMSTWRGGGREAPAAFLLGHFPGGWHSRRLLQCVEVCCSVCCRQYDNMQSQPMEGTVVSLEVAKAEGCCSVLQCVAVCVAACVVVSFRPNAIVFKSIWRRDRRFTGGWQRKTDAVCCSAMMSHVCIYMWIHINLYKHTLAAKRDLLL